MDELKKIKNAVTRLESMLTSLQEEIDEIYDRLHELEADMAVENAIVEWDEEL